MRIVYVGGRVKSLVAAEAFEVDATRNGHFSAYSRNTHDHFAALPDLAPQ
jgi:hypothetical protein